MKNHITFGKSSENLDDFIHSIRILRDEALILDQTLLPHLEEVLVIRDYRQCVEAIKKLRIRGAPAIGIAAAAAAYLAILEFQEKNDFSNNLERALNEIEASRPTAVNLFKATSEIRSIIDSSGQDELATKIYDYSQDLIRYETDACIRMGENGAREIRGERLGILSHCNTGALATVGIGTALGVIRTIAKDRPVHVFVDETRPLLQGARLTAWELMRSGIPCSLITDSMAATVMRSGWADCVITGADRIAANGDSANKIGTLGLSVLAKHFGIPFYIVAPESTIDRSIETGMQINIEERSADEVASFRGVRTAPQDCRVYNPAFDVAPNELITSIITEVKAYHKPYDFSDITGS